MSMQTNLASLKNESSEKHLNDAIVAISKLSKDITIISGENEEICANKHLLDLFTSAICPLFSSLGNQSNTLFLPNCSTTSIKYLLNVITTFTLMGNIEPKPRPTIEKIEEETKIEVKHEQNTIENTNLKEEKYSDQMVNNLECEEPLIDDNTFESNTECPKKEVFCYDCNENVFINQNESMATHNNQLHNQKLNCPFCLNKQVKSENMLKKHIKKFHLEEKTELLCSDCGFASVDIDDYFSHMNIHKVKINMQCDECPKIFNDKNKFKSHMNVTHKKTGPEICPYCSNLFKYLDGHILTKHTNKERYKCDQCDYKSYAKQNIDYHYKRIHENFVETCSACGKVVKDLKQHRRRGCSESIIVKRFTCEQCEKAFTFKQKLTLHIKQVHLNIRDKKCEQCDYRTATDFNLKIHVTRVHEGKSLRTECEHCKKKVFNVQRHIQSYHKQ